MRIKPRLHNLWVNNGLKIVLNFLEDVEKEMHMSIEQESFETAIEGEKSFDTTEEVDKIKGIFING